MAKKYKLLPKKLVKFTDPSGNEIERKMHRIKALRDIPLHNVKSGDLGGWVNTKHTLSQSGESWVGGEAIAYSDYWTGILRINGNALVTGKSVIHGDINTRIRVCENAVIEDNVKLFVHGSLHGESQIYGNARLSGDAIVENPAHITGQISGKAHVSSSSSVKGGSQVTGNATVKNSTVEGKARVMDNAVVTNGAKISENAAVADEARVSGAEIRGTATVSGKADVQTEAVVCDSATVTDDAVVNKNAIIAGQSIIKDAVVVPESARVLGKSIISGESTLTSYNDYSDFISAGNRTLSVVPSPKELTGPVSRLEAEGSDVQEVCLKLDGLEKEITAYGNDIVKLLKFPIMSDLRDENTLDMMLALKNSKSIDPASNPKKFRKAVNSLERKFMKAESNARIICATAFSDEQRKKAEKARDLFAVACNEVSSEQEKKNAFKQGFRQLEGVVDVTDSAIENMRVKVGILELEA